MLCLYLAMLGSPHQIVAIRARREEARGAWKARAQCEWRLSRPTRARPRCCARRRHRRPRPKTRRHCSCSLSSKSSRLALVLSPTAGMMSGTRLQMMHIRSFFITLRKGSFQSGMEKRLFHLSHETEDIASNALVFVLNPCDPGKSLNNILINIIF